MKHYSSSFVSNITTEANSSLLETIKRDYFLLKGWCSKPSSVVVKNGRKRYLALPCTDAQT